MNIFTLCFSLALKTMRGKTPKRISFLTLLSVTGVALGIIILLTTSSVFNGFQHQFGVKRVDDQGIYRLQVDLEDNNQIKRLDTVLTFLDDNNFKYSAKYVISAYLFSSDAPPLSSDYPSSDYIEILTQAGLSEDEIVVPLSNKFKTSTAILATYTPYGPSTPSVIFKQLKVNKYIDSKSAYISPTLHEKLRKRATFKNLTIQVSGLANKEKISDKLDASLQYIARENGIPITSFKIYSENIVRLLDFEKFISQIVLSFILVLSFFILTISIYFDIYIKKSEIAVFKTIGLSNLHIINIFLIKTFIIITAGTIIGVIGGYFFSAYFGSIVHAFELMLGVNFVQENFKMYKIPSLLKPVEFYTIPLIVYVLGFIMCSIPISLIAKQNPAELLKEKT